jgi:flagellar basal body-associated protein FliL
MVATIIRGVFLFALALMIVTWAMTASDSKPSEQEQSIPVDRIYS